VKKTAWTVLMALMAAMAAAAAAASPRGKVVTVTGEAVLANLTPDEARVLALKRARHNAIEEVCAVRVQAETLVQNFVLQGDFTHAVAYGNILDEKILRWDAEVVQKSPTDLPEITYKVTLQAEVLEEKGEPDPFFNVHVSLNKPAFENGDELVMKVRSTKPGYITVLNFAADGSVVVLFPNAFRRNNRIEADRDYTIPAPGDRDVIRFQVSTLPGHRKDTEYIKVICTREPLDLMQEVRPSGTFSVMNDTTLALTEVARVLSSIPLKYRAEDTAIYQIIDPQAGMSR